MYIYNFFRILFSLVEMNVLEHIDVFKNATSSNYKIALSINFNNYKANKKTPVASYISIIIPAGAATHMQWVR